MKSQTVSDDFTAQKIVLIALAIWFMVLLIGLALHQLSMVDPYVQQVSSLTGNVEMGHAMFQMNCAGCHGLEADGKVGPSLRGVSARKSRIGLIHQVTSGETPPMPQFQASPQEMADLLSYLEQL
ncbi:MAG TPA: cytochrome c [Candidatus Caenarcaniphilales bacterium]